MAQVWTLDLDHPQQAVLMALADHADDFGVCYPSTGYIAWKTGYSERQTQRILDDLEKNKIIKVAKRDTPTMPKVFQLQLKNAPKKQEYKRNPAGRGVKVSPLEDEGVTNDDARGDISDVRGDISVARGDITVSPKPSVQPSVYKPSTESLELPEKIESSFQESPRNPDDEGFGALLEDVQARVTNLAPSKIEQLGMIWDDYPDLECHEFALNQTDKYADGFNLKYYEQCCSSWWAKHKKGQTNGKQNNAAQGQSDRPGQDRPERGSNGRSQRGVPANLSQQTAWRATSPRVLSGVQGQSRAGPNGNHRA